jgi:hypothetical protein
VIHPVDGIDLVPGTYDRWSRVFDDDSEWRASFGLHDETKTIKAKVSETTAIAMLFDVTNLPKILELMSTPEFAAKTEGLFASPHKLFVGSFAPAPVAILDVKQ